MHQPTRRLTVDWPPDPCGCCQGIGWTSPDTWFSCRVDHHETFDFAGTVMVACPHCNDDTPVEPLRAPCESVEEASRLLAPLAAMVVSRHVDELGFHRGELRQQRALDRLERIFGYGHHATGQIDQLDRRAA